jgi:hypothetical protein
MMTSKHQMLKPAEIRTIGQAYALCQYRSLVSLIPGSPDDLLARIGAAFAALGGEICPIEPAMLAHLVETVRGGQTVVALSNRRNLRDAAKAQLMAAINASMHGAVGSA